MSGHTPGPWAVTKGSHGQAWGGYWQIDAEYDAVCCNQYCAAPEGEANARLIAAAPDLLEALKGLAEWVQDHSRYPDLCEPLKVARAAIAKATQSAQVSL